LNIRATYRLQLHKDFTFADAAARVPYLADLGISHLYASPILTARPGSTHGYDGTDPTQVNTELGGEAGLRQFVEALHRRDLGLIVDFVPNHLAADLGNPWWRDVLAHGQDSPYADFFDISWEAGGGKVCLPILGKPLRQLFDAGLIKIKERDLDYAGNLLPLSPGSLEEGPLTWIRLKRLLDKQHYHLAYWRTGVDRLNWRRFFDINELAGLAIERPAVFEAVHSKIFELYAEGLIDGLRLDHIDGLRDPRGYCRKLRRRLAALRPDHPPYILVEKILARDEEMPLDWQTDGTTGYDFMAQVSALQHDPAGDRPMIDLWEQLDEAMDVEAQEQAARHEILAFRLFAEFEAASLALLKLAQAEDEEADLALIRRALRRLIAHFPVYRTYAGPAGRSPQDRKLMHKVLALAMEGASSTEKQMLAKLDRWLGGEAPRATPLGPLRTARLEAIRRFQQLSAPTAAKSVEDTLFYRLAPQLSRNDVGSTPGHFSLDVASFHAATARRPAQAMLTTATHDHKRGEDSRARLAVLSEIPNEWAAAVEPWMDLASAHHVHPVDAYFLYQTILGAWPLTGSHSKLEDRLRAWQRKALREAKQRSDWALPNETYEAACGDLLAEFLSAETEAMNSFVRRLAPAATLNSLTQTVLRCTLPGVPDLYQGCEYWDFSLVDPDNRRPVDYARREATLKDDFDLTDWRSGILKQTLIRQLLLARQTHPALFAKGSYEPLSFSEGHADRLIGFVRRWQDQTLLVIVPRLTAPLVDEDQPTIRPQAWGDTRVTLPDGFQDIALRNCIDGRAVRLQEEVAGFIGDFPLLCGLKP
jgi:malto-oligosyltrehalose synthase